MWEMCTLQVASTSGTSSERNLMNQNQNTDHWGFFINIYKGVKLTKKENSDGDGEHEKAVKGEAEEGGVAVLHLLHLEEFSAAAGGGCGSFPPTHLHVEILKLLNNY